MISPSFPQVAHYINASPLDKFGQVLGKAHESNGRAIWGLKKVYMHNFTIQLVQDLSF